MYSSHDIDFLLSRLQPIESEISVSIRFRKINKRNVFHGKFLISVFMFRRIRKDILVVKKKRDVQHCAKNLKLN